MTFVGKVLTRTDKDIIPGTRTKQMNAVPSCCCCWWDRTTRVSEWMSRNLSNYGRAFPPHSVSTAGSPRRVVSMQCNKLRKHTPKCTTAVCSAKYTKQKKNFFNLLDCLRKVEAASKFPTYSYIILGWSLGECDIGVHWWRDDDNNSTWVPSSTATSSRRNDVLVARCSERAASGRQIVCVCVFHWILFGFLRESWCVAWWGPSAAFRGIIKFFSSISAISSFLFSFSFTYKWFE